MGAVLAELISRWEVFFLQSVECVSSRCDVITTSKRAPHILFFYSMKLKLCMAEISCLQILPSRLLLSFDALQLTQ